MVLQRSARRGDRESLRGSKGVAESGICRQAAPRDLSDLFGESVGLRVVGENGAFCSTPITALRELRAELVSA
jgi:hypothetical protein